MGALLAGEGIKAVVLTLGASLAAFLSLEALGAPDPQGGPFHPGKADIEAAVLHADSQREPPAEIFVPAHWER